MNQYEKSTSFPVTALTCAVMSAILISGCAPKTYQFSLSSVKPMPAGLMIAKKQQYPLYLVLDRQRIPAEWLFKVGNDTGVISDVDLFVKRDLKNALSQFFQEVQVVNRIPENATHYWAADIKVDRVEQVKLVRGALTYLPMQMKWQFALRGHQAEDYLFTFGDSATSIDTYPSLIEGAKLTIETAIERLTKAMVDKGVFKLLLEAEKSGKPPAPITI